MKTAENSMFATYEPQRYKTFQGALEAFFEQECPQLGGARTRMTLVNAVFQMVQRFFPDSTHMKQGQIIWTTVRKDEKGSYGKTIKNSRLTPVVLDLIPTSDITDRANGKKLRDMKKDAAARICRQAFEQDGCMTLATLVDQYLWLIEKYKKSGYILERLENLEINIESFIERQRQDS